MSERPRSRFLTHLYPMWQGCSLKELLFLMLVIIGSFIVISFVLSLFFGYMSLFILLFALCLYPIGIVSAKAFASYKKGKPQNFVFQDIGRRLGLGADKRLTRTGVWETRRTLTLRE